MNEKKYTIQESTGYWVSRLAKTMEAHFEKNLSSLNITRGSWAILSAIYHHDKKTPAELAIFVGIDGAAITRHLDRLENQGLIKRNNSRKDRRSLDIEVTEKGKELIPKVVKASKATNDHFLNDFSNEEIEIVQTLLRKMILNGTNVPHDI